MNNEAFISIALVEDEPHTRDRFASLLGAHADLRLDAVFEGANDAIAWLQSHEPDVLLVDLGLPDRSGLDVIRICARLHPICSIMVITMFGDERNVLASIQAGAKGYVLKDDLGDTLAGAVRTLCAGGSPMSPIIARQVLQRLHAKAGDEQPPARRASDTFDTLSAREIEVLEYIARGYTYAEIARLLNVTMHTVQAHIKHIYAKLAVHSRSEAIFEARQLGLLAERNATDA
ncbi:MAG TPA: response regulator transcription factor [Burkholderiaceae bacterium]|nr:response regulator transcription factor [Burkholderiaceae bacterium]